MTAKWNQPANVFTTVPGLELRIGQYGVATNDTPCLVPDAVADELQRDIDGSVTEAERKAGVERAKRTDIRLERVEPAKPAAPAPKAAKSGDKE